MVTRHSGFEELLHTGAFRHNDGHPRIQLVLRQRSMPSDIPGLTVADIEVD
jgi:hypothetical protein